MDRKRRKLDRMALKPVSVKSLLQSQSSILRLLMLLPYIILDSTRAQLEHNGLMVLLSFPKHSPDLMMVISSWSELPEHIRATILTLIKAFGK